MQLGTSTIPILPAVAVGAALLLAVLVCWGVSRARRVPVAASPYIPDGGADAGPCAEDWTGEAAAGAADPPPPAPSATVADAVAARRADTRPFPSVPDAADLPPRDPWMGSAPDGSEPVPAGDAMGDRGPGPAAPGPDAPDPGASDDELGRSTGGGPSARVPSHGRPSVTGNRSAAGAAGAAGEGGDAAQAGDRVRTRARHAYAPQPATAAVPRTVHDPWAVPAEPDPWAAPAAPDPAKDLAASDSTAELPAYARPVSAPSGSPAPTAEATSPRSGSTAGPDGTDRPVEPSAPAPSADPPVLDPEPAPPVEPPSAAVPEPGDAARSGELRDEQGDASMDPDVDTGPAPAATAGIETAGIETAGAATVGAVTAGAATAGTTPRPECDAPAVLDATPGDRPETAEDAAGPERVDPIGAAESGPIPPPWSAARSGPDAARGSDPDATDAAAPISVAVAQALAAREMQRARGVPPEDAVGSAEPSVPDARDRLLSVLLCDPVAALGAATELDDTRVRIDQLGAVLRRRRADLATAVHRLHASGLTGEQIGRLSGLEADDVRAILDRRAEEGASER